jgi:uncharacterized protein YkwD
MEANGIDLSEWGENINFGHKTPESVVSAWMRSERHRDNIMYSEFTDIGVGYVDCGDGWTYWTMELFLPGSPEAPLEHSQPPPSVTTVAPPQTTTTQAASTTTTTTTTILGSTTSSPPAIVPGSLRDCGSTAASRMVELVNQERENENLPPLECSSRGTLAAEQFSDFMCQVGCELECSDDLDGRTPEERLADTGIQAAEWGENIAYRKWFKAPESVMDWWMADSVYSSNIVDSEFTHIGVGTVDCGDGWSYWTMELFRPSSTKADPPTTLSQNPPAQLFGCFSGDSRVEVKNRGPVSMKNLAIGDFVKVAGNEFSEVYSFGHYDSISEASYLSIDTGLTKPLIISKNHLLFVQGRAVAASEVKIGDMLRLGNGLEVAVRKITSIQDTGLYAPFTKAGTIEVNNVIASCYVTMLLDTKLFPISGLSILDMHVLAHIYQAPHRLVCEVASEFCNSETYSENGISSWVAAPFSITMWALQQNSLVFSTLVFVTLPVVLSAALIEFCLISSPGLVIALLCCWTLCYHLIRRK